MTGYSAKNFTFTVNNDSKVNVLISIKTLNSRFFELTPRMPYIFNALETYLIGYFKKELKRGHIYLNVTLSDPDAFQTDIEPSLSSLKGYLKAIDKIKKTFNIQQEVTISDILRLPNILITKEENLDEKLKNNFFDAIEILTKELINERNKEGTELQKDIEKRITIMQEKIQEISIIFEKTFKSRQEEINKKLVSLDSESEIDEIRIKAFYLELDKMDIN